MVLFQRQGVRAMTKTTPVGDVWITCVQRHLQLARDCNDEGRDKILILIELLERFFPEECEQEKAKWTKP